MLTATPLPWRKITPLHRKLGPRAIRYLYTGGNGIPLTASPASLAFRYDAIAAMDRIIAFTLSIGVSSGSASFKLSELNTGWFYQTSFTSGAFVVANVETLPDEASLQWSFSGAVGDTVFLSFRNVEDIPVKL